MKASAGVAERPVRNLGEGSKKKARIEEQVVDTMMVDREETPLDVTWIPVVDQVFEVEVVPNARNKAGKMKARARAKAKEKPAAKGVVDSEEPTPPPPTRKSQRARQVPLKFRALVPRPHGLQPSPPLAPNFVHPPNANGIQSLQLPHNLILPFPPIPVTTPPSSSSTSSPATASGSLHLSTFPRISDQVLVPTSTRAATLALPRSRSRSLPAERSRKRGAERQKLSRSPSQVHAGPSQSPSPQSPNGVVPGASALSPGDGMVSKRVFCSGGLLSTSTSSSSVCATQVAPNTQPNGFVNIFSSPSPTSCGSDQLPSLLGVNGASTSRPLCNGKSSAALVERPRSTGKPPLPPLHTFYRRFLQQNPPHPTPAVLSRSFAHVPPPPTHDRYPMVPSRASLNNRDLRFPKASFNACNPLFGTPHAAQNTPNSHIVPWLVPPQRDGNQHNTPVGGADGGISIPEPTRSQQKRRMRHMKNGLGKKLQNFMQEAKLMQEANGQRQGTPPVKQILITKEQRDNLVLKMIEACRNNVAFRTKYLDAVKQLSFYGVLQTASYQLVAQGPSPAAQQVVDSWKSLAGSSSEGSTSASIKFYTAVNKVHEEGEEVMQKLPNLKEAGSCSLSKRSDGPWLITLPDEKKRKLNGEERHPTNVS